MRSIPACAGEPCAYPDHPNSSRVYPRVCGGTRRAISASMSRRGLSPRVRGNPARHLGQRHLDRSIPACAGEPLPVRVPAQQCGVYPRVCGGTVRRRIEDRAMTGLSPRVRGNRSTRARAATAPRSIPACAGEPAGQLLIIGQVEVYPRVCGGTRRRRKGGRSTSGLSPRVRGNLGLPAKWQDKRRSIPACAGEPDTVRFVPLVSVVYPRVCGGTGSVFRGDERDRGLSPRVRGNRGPYAEVVSFARSIPACAGEPVHWKGSLQSRRVYPRVCGGTMKAKTLDENGTGLSPRVRGNPLSSLSSLLL